MLTVIYHMQDQEDQVAYLASKCIEADVYLP